MGDSRRFDVFAKFLARNFPKDLSVADVAGGKGYLNLALKENGFKTVVTFDPKRRREYCRGITIYNKRFTAASNRFGLIIGLHPDEATDVIIDVASQWEVPFAVVPCCVKPYTWIFHGQKSYSTWIAHIVKKAEQLGFKVSLTDLPINGRRTLITGRPYGKYSI